ncbi:hypothetical protein MRX96_044342 [Rhipicephalus microplus]
MAPRLHPFTARAALNNEKRDSEIGAPCPRLAQRGHGRTMSTRRTPRAPEPHEHSSVPHDLDPQKLKKKPRKARCLRGGRQSSPFERVSKKRKGAENRFPYLRHVADDRERAASSASEGGGAFASEFFFVTKKSARCGNPLRTDTLFTSPSSSCSDVPLSVTTFIAA